MAIWTKKSKTLFYFAYAGFIYDLILTASAHLVVQDGEWPGAAVALLTVLTAYLTDEKPEDRGRLPVRTVLFSK